MISNVTIGQSPAKFDNVIDNIFKLVCGMNFHEGKILLKKYNPSSLQPIQGHPFLVSLFDIPCYKIISIKNSVHAQDNNVFDIQNIDRNSSKELIENSQLIDEF